MSITIIYPKDDFEAANIAVKVQALAQSRGQRIYVVPKHYGRSKSEVDKNLQNTSIALFIAQASQGIDKGTIDELKYLKSMNKKVVGFLPDNLALPKTIEQFITLKRYHKGNSEELRTIVVEYLAEVQSNSDDKGGLLIVLGLILFLLLLAFNSDD